MFIGKILFKPSKYMFFGHILVKKQKKWERWGYIGKKWVYIGEKYLFKKKNQYPAKRHPICNLLQSIYDKSSYSVPMSKQTMTSRP